MVVYLDEFRESVRWSMSHAVEQAQGKAYDHKQLWLAWDKDKQIVLVEVCDDEYKIAKLNENKALKKMVSECLKETYRYEGEFRFSEETIPF